MGRTEFTLYFTSIPFEKIIITSNELNYNQNDIVKGSSKFKFKTLLYLAMEEPYVILNECINKNMVWPKAYYSYQSLLVNFFVFIKKCGKNGIVVSLSL